MSIVQEPQHTPSPPVHGWERWVLPRAQDQWPSTFVKWMCDSPEWTRPQFLSFEEEFTRPICHIILIKSKPRILPQHASCQTAETNYHHAGIAWEIEGKEGSNGLTEERRANHATHDENKRNDWRTSLRIWGERIKTSASLLQLTGEKDDRSSWSLARVKFKPGLPLQHGEAREASLVVPEIGRRPRHRWKQEPHACSLLQAYHCCLLLPTVLLDARQNYDQRRLASLPEAEC